MCNILFVTYGGGHARMLVPVVRRLAEYENIKITVLALTTAVLEFDAALVNIIGYKNYFFDDPRMKNYGELLIRELDKVVDREETVAYLGKNYLELVETLGEDAAKERYAKLGRQAFNPKNALKEILEDIGPDIIVTTNSPRSERAAIEAARELDIYSVALIDMFSIRCEAWFSKNNFADKVLVLSDSVKEHLVSKGRNANSVIVTGNPAFDSLVLYYNENKNNIRTYRSNAPFTVLWASQKESEYLLETDLYGDTQLPINIENTLLEIFSKYSDWRLIARNHPSETQREYPGYVSVSTQSDDLLKLLSRVDAVVTLTSTVGFQGAILGADFVTIDCSIFTPTMPFSKMGFSVGVEHINKIENVLKTLSEKNCDHNRKLVYSIDNATDNVVQEILTMVDL